MRLAVLFLANNHYCNLYIIEYVKGLYVIVSFIVMLEHHIIRILVGARVLFYKKKRNL